MSTFDPPKHASRKHELREDTVVTFYARAWEFVDRNRKALYGVLAAVVVLALIAVGYAFYLGQKQETAVDLLGSVVQLYEEGRYRDALDGTGDTVGLLEIAEDYGNTDAGNLASFYAADALFRLGDYDQALEYFEDYDKEEGLIGASAIAGEAAIHENRSEFERAGDLYRRAALFYENELRSPEYLLQAAHAYQQGGAYDDAEAALELITERFPESNIADGISFHMARLAAMRQTS